MQIEKGIRIRPFRREDLERYVLQTEENKEREVGLSFRLKRMSELYQAFEKNGLLSKEEGRLLIVSEEDQILGYLSYFKGSPYVNGYEIGYQIFSEVERKKGYGTEAVRQMVKFLFESYPILRLQICFREENIASQRVAEKAGFLYEGTLKSVYKVRGKLINHKLYALTRSEWEQNKEGYTGD